MSSVFVLAHLFFLFASSALGRISPFFGVVSVWSWFILPGVLLTLFWKNRIRWLERIPLAFSLSVGFYAPFTILAILFQSTLTAFQLTLTGAFLALAVGYYLWAPEYSVSQESPVRMEGITFGVVFPALITIITAAGLVYLSLVWPPAGDDLAGLPLYQEVLTKGRITNQEPFHGTGTPVTPRNELVIMGYQTALLANIGLIEPALFLVNSRAVLIVISFFAVYLFASRWFRGVKFGLTFTSLWGIYLLSHLHFDGDGNNFVTRIFQDKFMIWFIVIPALLTIFLWYVETGQRKYLVIFGIGAWGAAITHPVSFMILLILTAGYAILHLSFEWNPTELKKFALVGIVFLICLVVPVVQYIRFMGDMPLDLAGYDQAVEFSRYSMAVGRYRLLFLDNGQFILHPSRIMQPVTLLGLLLAVLLVREARDHKGVRLALSSIILFTILLYVPWTASLVGKFATPYLLWRLAWPYPFLALLILTQLAFSGADCVQKALQHETFEKLVNQSFVGLVIVIAGLVSLPAVRSGSVQFFERKADIEHSPCYQAQEGLNFIQGTNGEKEINVLASPKLNLCIPGTVGDANVVEYRGLGTVNRLPMDQVSASMQRVEDAEYFSRALSVDHRLVEIIKRYDIDLILLERDRMGIEHQFRMMPDWFTVEYQDDDYSLFAVKSIPEATPLIEGNEALRLRLWLEAEKSFQKALEENPEDVLAYLGLAKAYVGQGNLDQAMEACAEAVNYQPSEAAVQVQSAELNLIALQLEEAVKHYQKAQELAPERAGVKISLGKMHYVMGDLEAAREHLLAGVADITREGTARYYAEAGKQLARYNWIGEAEVYYQQALNMSPDPKVYVEFGQALSRVGKYEEAITAANQALKIDRWFYDAYSLLGKTYQVQGDMEKAIEMYRKAVSMNPTDPKLYIDLAKALQEHAGMEQAVAEMEERENTFSFLPGPRAGLIPLYFINGDAEAAIREYDHLVSYMPRRDTINVSQGYLYLDLGDYENAHDKFGEVLYENPGMISASTGLAKLFSVTGEYDQEIGERYLVSERTPLSSWPHLMLAQTNMKIGNLEKAEEEYLFGIHINTNWPASYMHLGNFYFSHARWDEALEAYQNAYDLNPRDTDALIKIGQTYWKKADLETSQRYFEEVTQQAPNDVKAHLALAQLNWLRGEADASIEIVDQIIEGSPTLLNDLEVIVDTLRMQGRMEKIDELYEAVFSASFPLASDFPAWAQLDLPDQEDDERAALFVGEPGEEQTQLMDIFRGATRFYVSQGDHEKAQTIAALNVDMYPDSAQARISQAELWILAGERETAVRMIQNGLLQVQDRGALYRWLANDAIKHGEFQKGENFLRKVKEVSPEDDETLIELADLYRLREEYVSAESLLTENWSKEKSTPVLLSLVSLYHHVGQTDRIEALLQEGEELFPTNVSVLFEAGRYFQKQGDFDRAEQYYLTAVELEPLNPKTLLALGDFYIREEMETKALKAYQEAANLDRGDIQSIQALAAYYQNQGLENTSQKVLENAVQMLPGEAILFVQLGDLHYENMHLDQALSAYEKACSLDASYSGCYLGQGRVLTRMGDLEKAEAFTLIGLQESPTSLSGYIVLSEIYRLADRVQDLDPYLQDMVHYVSDKKNAYAYRANFYARQGNRQAARDDYQYALERWPGFSSLRIQYAKFYKHQNDLQRALEILRDEVKRNGLTCETGSEIGGIYLLQADWFAARTEYQQLINADPHCTKAYRGLGNSYEMVGETSRAMEVYQEGIAANPDEPAFLVSLGEIYLRQLKYQEAEEAFSGALALTPDHLDALLGLEKVAFLLNKEIQIKTQFEHVYQNLNDPDDLANYVIRIQGQQRWHESEDYIQQILAVDPFNPLGWLALGNQHAHEMDFLKTEEAYHKAVLYSSHNMDALLALGNLYLNQEEYPLAEETFKEITARYPTQMEGYLALADLYDEMGRRQEQRELLEAAVQMIPSADELFEALARYHWSAGEKEEAKGVAGAGLEKIPGSSNLYMVLGELYAREYFVQYRRFVESDASVWWYQYIIDQIQASEKYAKRGPSPNLKKLKNEFRLALVKLDLAEENLQDSQGNVDQAIAYFLTALELDPGNERAMIGLARLEDALGFPESALEYYQNAYYAKPNSIMALNSLGFAFLARGNPESALPLFERSLMISPNQPLALLGKFKALVNGEEWGAGESAHITQSGQFWWENLIVRLREVTLGKAVESSTWTNQQARAAVADIRITGPESWTGDSFGYGHSYVQTYSSPDGQAVFQIIAYDDGETMTREIAGLFALALINETYGKDLIVTKDQVSGDWENLHWQAYDDGYQGLTGFTVRDNSLLILTYIYENDREAEYKSILNEMINQAVREE